MTEYGVQTNNIFDLLNAADDNRTGAAKPKPRKKKGGAASGQPKKEGGQAKPQARPASQVRATTVTVSGGRGAGAVRAAVPQSAPAPSGGSGRGGSAGGRGSPAQGGSRPQGASRQGDVARRFDESHVSFEEDRPVKSVPHRHDGVPVVKHNAPNRGREFDRHSGTGRSPVENKKGGAGQANWGALNEQDELTALDDVKAELAAESDQAKKEKEDRKKNKKKKKKGKKGEEEEEKDKKEEIPDEQLKTFDDFLKEQAAKATKLSLPPPRAAGEGAKEDPKWATAVKREDKEEVFVPVKVKEEPKKEEDEKKPSKSSLRKKRKKERKQQEAKRLAEENIVNMFDFSAKKEHDRPPRGGPRGPREGGSDRPRGPRGPREGGNDRPRGPRGPREGGSDRPREGGNGGPRGPRAGPRNPQQPKKFRPGDNEGPQFDASAFPALQVGPPPITVD